jgi:hypothetical protein
LTTCRAQHSHHLHVSLYYCIVILWSIPYTICFNSSSRLATVYAQPNNPIPPYSYIYIYYMDRSEAEVHILFCGWQTINCHLGRSAMNYLLYYTQYMQICQTTCFCCCISKTKNEFGHNLEENIILTGPSQYTRILTGQYTKILTGCANIDK